MNEKFFKPRKLFCLVMTWNPNDPRYTADMDFSATLHNEMMNSSPIGAMDKTKHAMRVSSGKGNEFEFPETAPLIFPGLDAQAMYDPKDPEGKKTKTKIKSSMRFVNEYMDKRAHAKWAGQNPDSQLARTVKTDFQSRYADPNHPASSGDLLALVTGGKVSSMQLAAARGGGVWGQGRRGFGGGLGGGLGGRGFGGGGGLGGGLLGGGYDRWGGRGGGWGDRGRLGGGQGYDDPYYENQYNQGYDQPPGYQQNYPRSRSPSPNPLSRPMPYRGLSRGGLIMGGGFGGGLMGMSPLGLILGGSANLLQKNILYLMIVQMPSDDELAEAAEMEEREHRKG